MDYTRPISHRRHDKLATTDSLPVVEELPVARAGPAARLQSACWFLLGAIEVVVLIGVLYLVYWEVHVFRMG